MNSFNPPILSGNTMHVIDYKVHGDDMQFVEIELDPNEAVVAEAGGMMFMDDGIAMETIFGDGSTQNRGFVGALRALSRKDPAHPTGLDRRGTHRPKGLVSLRGKRRFRQHRLPEKTRRRPLRRRGLHHATAPRRRLGLHPRRRHAL